jgi:hypothetical protein
MITLPDLENMLEYRLRGKELLELMLKTIYLRRAGLLVREWEKEITISFT